MTKLENFRYNEVVLYCKGWYVATDNILADLEKYIRRNEDYCYPKTMHASDIMGHMLNALELLYESLPAEELKNKCWYHTHKDFIFKVQYYEKLFSVDFEEAVCLLVCSIFQNLSNKFIKLNPPKYDKQHRYGGGLLGSPKQGMTYKEMNKLWNKF